MADKDQFEGAAKQAQGHVKDAAGKLTGNTRLEMEGKADKVAGGVQRTVGDVKSDLKKPN